jgi:outer membrane protein assembly factor BamB
MPTCGRAFLAMLLTIGLLPCLDAGTWPRFRGPNGDGIAPAGQDIPLEFDAQTGILWKTPLPGFGNSSPVVWDQHIFLQTATTDGKERRLLCLDAAHGQVRWQRSIPGVHVKVRGESSLASATPALDGEAVYVPFWDGAVVHMNAYSFEGELLWSKNLGRWISQHGTGSSPIIVGDKVIFAYDMDVKDMKGTPIPESRPSMLMAFHKKTGDLAWETPREGYRACYSAPFILQREGAPELVVTSTMSIDGYNPDTGKQLWTWSWDWEKARFKMPLRTVADALVVDGMLIATSGDGGGDRRMVALRLPKNGATAPSYVWGDGNKLFPYVSGPLAHGEHVYFVNDRGFAGCYHAKTGKQLWYERVPGATFLASPVLIQGKIYAASVEGDVFVIAAEPSFRLLAKNVVGERFVASPAVADGRMYLRGQTHLFCVGKK